MRFKIFLFMIIFCGNVSVSQTRYVDAVFKDVSSKTYIYAIKNVDTLKLDLYQPVDDRLKKRPLFVIIHGGGFTTGTRTDASLISLANGIAKKGFVVASVDYRLLPKQKSFNCNIPVQEALQIYSKAQGDVLEAILYALNDTFKTDASKIILFGTSAGAETALNIAYNKSAVKHRSKRIKNISIAGLISVSGALVNSNLITQTNAVPGAFYHGKKDTMLPYYQGAHHSCSILNSGYFLMDGSKKIVERLENLEASFLFYGYKNKGHDIFNLPSKDFKDAFLFLKRVVFDGTFYQKKVIQ